jgi:hypothetical protein
LETEIFEIERVGTLPLLRRERGFFLRQGCLLAGPLRMLRRPLLARSRSARAARNNSLSSAGSSGRFAREASESGMSH